MRKFPAFFRNQAGGTAAEFALVVPLAIIFLLGIIDVGRLMWTWNMAEKATQMGVRYAVVADYVAPSIASQTFVGQSGLTQGDVVPITAYGTTTCDKPPAAAIRCSCAGICPWGASPAVGPATGSPAKNPYTRIFDRMHAIMPELTPENIKVLYQPSGIGFAGDPNGSDIAPLVTVQLTDVSFTPMVFQLFGGSITLPDFRASLTLEDGAGTVSN
jgi:Flp pilus assembly pilin Flp